MFVVGVLDVGLECRSKKSPYTPGCDLNGIDPAVAKQLFVITAYQLLQRAGCLTRLLGVQPGTSRPTDKKLGSNVDFCRRYCSLSQTLKSMTD